MNKQTKATKIPYPAMITNLAEIDISAPGIKGWALQSSRQQFVFFEIDPIGEVSPHSHCAQWGLMVEGKMRLTIGQETKIYSQGDHYFIPAGVIHSATFLTKVYVIDIFDDPQRYKIKKNE